MKSAESTTWEPILAQLAALYAELDAQTARLDALHAGRLSCRRGCAQCSLDGLTVFEVEAEKIRRRHGELLRSVVPHPAGGCAFLDASDACRIYESRPYVCRTQGYPLRWLDEADAGETVELRDICPLNDEPSRPLEDLPELDCWMLGPFEGRLAALQEAATGRLDRVGLRELFRPLHSF